MDRRPLPVKSRRAYDASRRQEQARLHYETALVSARRRFVDNGYVATTVEAIAEEAGVSPATIYKSYGGKAGLARALCERALAGDGQVPAEQRSDALRSGDPRTLIEGWGKLATEVAPRVVPLLLVLRDAARTDPDAAALRAELDDGRLTRMADNARHLHDAGHLREGVSASAARDVMWLTSSPEMYELLVNRRGWSIDAYGRFVTDTLIAALL